MARQPRYEDYVSYDPDPVEEPVDDEAWPTRCPWSGRPIGEFAEWQREKAAKAALFLNGVAA